MSTLLPRKVLAGQKAEEAEPVVQGDEDDALGDKRRVCITRLRACASYKPPSVNPLGLFIFFWAICRAINDNSPGMALRAPIFLLLICSAPVYSQTLSGVSCTAAAPAFPYVNVEGIAEQTGDILITCTGGTHTPAGVPVPTTNISVAFNTQETSRTPDGMITDALLLIDEPGSGTGSLTPAFCPAMAGTYACSTTVVGAGMGGGQNTIPSSLRQCQHFPGRADGCKYVDIF